MKPFEHCVESNGHNIVACEGERDFFQPFFFPLTFFSGKLAVAGVDKTVKVFRISPDGSSVAFWSEVCKFELQAFCVDLDPSAKMLVCGSQCGALKCFDVSEENAKLKLDILPLNDKVFGAVHSVAIDPRGQNVVCSLSDGSVRLFSLNTGEEKKCLRERFISNAQMEEDELSMVCWSRDGEHIAVPSAKEKKVDIYDRFLEHTIRSLSLENGVSCTSFSPNSLYIACASGSGVHVFRSDSGKRVSQHDFGQDQRVRKLVWSPFANVLVATTLEGSAHFWESPIPNSQPDPCKPFKATAAKEDVIPMDLGDDDEDDDFMRAAALVADAAEAKKSSQEEVSPATQMVGKEVGEEEVAEKEEQKRTEKNSQSSQKSGLLKRVSSAVVEDFANDDVDELFGMDDELPAVPSYKEEMLKLTIQSQIQESTAVLKDEILRNNDEFAERYGLFEPQYPFTPSATVEVSQKGPRRRVLSWNRVGRVTCLDDRTESIVEVDFADVTMHRKIRVADLYSYTMGSLSEAGVVLAAGAVQEQGTRAVVHFKPVSGLVGGAEWQDMLETGDDVLGVALGVDWIAAVCFPYLFLRIWSVSGLQSIPIQLPISKFVSMVGHGSRLAIFHNSPSGSSVLVYDMSFKRLVFNTTAPLSPGAELTWCGYTPLGVLVTMDSAGVGRMLVNSGDWAGQWIPLIQPEGPIDVSRRWPSGWPIGATDDALIVIRLTVEEEKDYGLVLDDDERGAPTIDTIRWNTPLVGPNSALSVGLETVLRKRVMLSQNAEPNARKELEVDSEIVKLVSLAAKNGHPERAMELFFMIRSIACKGIATKWCGANGFDQLFLKMEAEYRAALNPNHGTRSEFSEDDVDDRHHGEEEEEEDEEMEERDLEETEKKSKRKTSASDVDDVFDDEAADISPPPTKITKKKTKSRTNGSSKNPFSTSKKSALKRSSSSSGGVMEALARIESGAKKIY